MMMAIISSRRKGPGEPFLLLFVPLHCIPCGVVTVRSLEHISAANGRGRHTPGCRQLITGPKECILGIGYLAQGSLGRALLPQLPAHIPSFVHNLWLPGLKLKTPHFPAQCPYRLSYCTLHAHHFPQLLSSFVATAGHLYHG